MNLRLNSVCGNVQLILCGYGDRFKITETCAQSIQLHNVPVKVFAKHRELRGLDCACDSFGALIEQYDADFDFKVVAQKAYPKEKTLGLCIEKLKKKPEFWQQIV